MRRHSYWMSFPLGMNLNRMRTYYIYIYAFHVCCPICPLMPVIWVLVYIFPYVSGSSSISISASYEMGYVLPVGKLSRLALRFCVSSHTPPTRIQLHVFAVKMTTRYTYCSCMHRLFIQMDIKTLFIFIYPMEVSIDPHDISPLSIVDSIVYLLFYMMWIRHSDFILRHHFYVT